MSVTATAAMAPPQSRPRDRADLTDWLAVAAGGLGALMATLDISIVNSALPTIQGEIGASGTEGTWIATSYLVAEVVIIPMSAWLERALGLRRFLLISAIFFTASSMLCGMSTSLMMMIIGRTGQGLSGGAMIPTALTIIATRLPGRQQPIGNAMFGFTAVMGPVLGPLVGGWLTENVSWHYAFFLNVPVSFLLVVLVMVGLPAQRILWDDLLDADWLGIAGLALGLGCLTVVLEEGQREQWFESTTILWLSAGALLGFILIAAGQAFARKPVIRMDLLDDRQFASVATMGFVLGVVLYGTSFVIPQFLANIANYNALQAGRVILLSGIPSLVVMGFTPLMIRHLDIRVAVGAGLAMMALSCWFDTDLTAQSAGNAFTLSQLLRGFGTIFVMLFLNQAVLRSVPATLAGDAAALFATARNLGGSVGLALLATIQDRRLYFHERRLEEALSANAVIVQDHLNGLARQFGDGATALRMMGATLQREALVMTYNDVFWVLTIGVLCVAPLVLFLRPLPDGQPLPMH